MVLGCRPETEEGSRLIEEPAGRRIAAPPPDKYLRHPLQLALLIAGAACLVVLAYFAGSPGAQKGPRGTTAEITKITRADDRRALMPFDCEADKVSWVLAWSFEKQSYCCRNVDPVFCTIPITTTAAPTMAPTTQELTTTAATTTSIAATTQGPAFDCSAGQTNAEMAWSDWKKRWCCTYQKIGCEDKQITGTFWVQNLHYDQFAAADKINSETQQAIKDTLLDIVAPKSSPMSSPLIHYRALDDAHLTKVDLNWYKSFSGGVAVHFAITPAKDIPEHLARERITCDTINDPVLEAIREVPDIATVSTVPLAIQDCKIDQSSAKVPCTCQNGEPVDTKDCPGEGGNLCKSCNDGFSMLGESCEANVCECVDGVGARGLACASVGAQVCGFCNAGFHLDQGDGSSECVQNVCTCSKGNPAVDAKCSQDESNICATCDTGYHLNTETRECEPNTCFCGHGSAPGKGTTECKDQEAYVCESCDQSYHLSKLTKRCAPNVCTCDGGTAAAAAGPECLRHQSEVCINCDNPLALLSEDGHCLGGKSCTCHGGTPVDDTDCTTNRGNLCKSCDVGYELRQRQCVKSSCMCDGGMPVLNCSADKADKACDTCEAGRHPSDGLCIVNTCVCPHGREARGDLCLESGGNVCVDCDVGYHNKVVPHGSKHIEIACEPNVCTCENGRAANPASNPVCRTHSQEYCISCEEGFQVNEHHRCAQIECKCENGVPLTGTKCPYPAFDGCVNCNPGFTKTGAHSKYKGATACEPNHVLEQGTFNCLLGYGARLLEWSPMKKNYCCEAHAIGCTATITASQVCLPEVPKPQCENIGQGEFQGVNQPSCCSHSGKACVPKSFNQVCYQSRLIKLKSSLANASSNSRRLMYSEDDPVESDEDRGMCLEAVPEKATGHSQAGKVFLARCNEWNPRQQWHYAKVNSMLRNAAAKTCLSTGTTGTTVTPKVDDAGVLRKCDPHNLATLVVVDGANLKMDSKKLCLAVRKKNLNKLGEQVRLQDCYDKKAKDYDMDWVLGTGVELQAAGVPADLPEAPHVGT